MYRTALHTPIGCLHLFADHGSLYRITFQATLENAPASSPAPQGHPLLTLAARQLDEYFNSNRKTFDLPLSPEGTAFQRAVWKLMLQIPYGETRTYGEIGARLGSPNMARAVGGAANRNPLPLVIPCHRVMGKNGKPTGFAGGLDIKMFLLELEKKNRG